ncbi:hypothetical protein ES707_18043 [subsurface metagenome]
MPSCITLPNGKGAFARGCLGPASRTCRGKSKGEFHSCRRERISSCRTQYGCVGKAYIPPTQIKMFP